MTEKCNICGSSDLVEIDKEGQYDKRCCNCGSYYDSKDIRNQTNQKIDITDSIKLS